MPSEIRTACRSVRRRLILSSQQIESFILGTCRDNIAVEIEEALFSDDAFCAQVQQAKTGLLEREALGQLSAETSAALALQLERSPMLREQLQQIRKAEVHKATPFVARNRPTRSFPWRFGLGFAVAAAVLSIILGSIRHPSKQAPTPSAHLTIQTTPPVAPATDLAPVASTILFLPSSVLRGPSESRELQPPDPARPVELQVQLRGSSAPATQWIATLTHEGHPVLSTEPVSSHSEGNIHYVSLSVHPGLLTTGEYHLTLTPSTTGTTAVPFDQVFAIRKK